ncbi:MAG: hypothetical protein WDZ59_14930 [Pirellulales bacterium]
MRSSRLSFRLSRLRRGGACFLAVLTVYWLYSQLAVPLIEPPATSRVGTTSGGLDRSPARIYSGRYQKMFEAYFPAGHWARKRPMVIESNRAMLLIEDYKLATSSRRREDEIVTLKKCAIVFFPAPHTESLSPPRDAVILEAPQGAVLEFAGDQDHSPVPNGPLKKGRLNGPITIRSDMNEPGPADDLHITTPGPVQLTEAEIFTPHPVEFQLGPHRGRGTEMRIRLLSGGGASGGFNVAGIGWFELSRDVELHAVIGGEELASAQGDAATAAGEPSEAVPLEVTCEGPFHFNFDQHVATFEDKVDVLRHNPAGPSDTLRCEQLSIYFAASAQSGAQAQPAGGSGAASLRPLRLEAVGQPVHVDMPSRPAHARCLRLTYEIESRRLTLEGDREVVLQDAATEITAPQIEYSFSADRRRLGTARADGPGKLRYVSPDDPSEVFEAHWPQRLQLRRDPADDAPVISLFGEPAVVQDGRTVRQRQPVDLRLADIGRMTSDEVHLWLLESSASAAVPSPASGESPDLSIAPDRLRAEGRVVLDSQMLTGKTDRLEVWFEQIAAPAAPATSPTGAGNSSGPPRAATAERASPRRTYDIQGRLIQIEMLLAEGASPEVASVTVEGQVAFAEKSTDITTRPLEIVGQRLEVTGAHLPSTHAVISGQPARVISHRMTMEGPEIHVDRAANVVRIDAPGEMSFPRNEGAAGADPMTITWQGGMLFDGRTVRYRSGVVAETPQQLMETGILAVTLTRPISFSRPSAADEIDVARIECQGQTYMENRTTEGNRQVSLDRIQLRNLIIDRQSGEIYGSGPGRLVTLRYGDAASISATPGQRVTPSPNLSSQSDGESKLNYLELTFLREMRGAIREPQPRQMRLERLTFYERIEAIYGPIATWQDRLDLNNPGRLRAGDFLLDCDQLTVAQSPLQVTGRPPIELETRGNVRVEGREFLARSHRMTYDQSKDLLTLEGDGTTDAQLWRQDRNNKPLEARAIQFWRSEPRVEVDDGRGFPFTHLDAANPSQGIPEVAGRPQ